MARPDLNWLELTDFSPGIHSNNNLAGGLNVTSTNIAYASPTNTFRCRALPTGGLGPLPRRKESFSLTTRPDSGNGYTYTINGLGTWGFVLADPSTNTNADHRIEVHLLVSYNVPNGGNWDQKAKWLREIIYNVTPSTETIYSDTQAAQAAQTSYEYAYFLKTRMNPASPNTIGAPVMVCIWTNPQQTLNVNKAFPDPASPTTLSTVTIGTATDTYRRAVAHQGRIVLAKLTPYDHGPATVLSTNENFLWTETNDNTLVTADTASFVPEIDHVITDMAAMSANQMVVVKSLGGGYVLTGDLSDVTVVQLPNLTSPDGTPTIAGCNTPIGWVYSAGNNGLYLWNGGDSSSPLSEQLDGTEFTNASSQIRQGFVGMTTRWLDLLTTAHLWVCDLNTRAWWRLDDPDDYPGEIWFVSASTYDGQLIAARETFTDATPECFYLFEHDDLAYSYSWQSHPLWLSRNRLIGVREGTIAIQGHGQVTVTVFDVSDDTNNSTFSFDVDSDVIENFRWDIGFAAENLAVRLESSGDNGSGPATYQAPLVHRVFLGWAEVQQQANANN